MPNNNLILIVAHYPLASALKEVAKHIFKNQADLIKTLDIKAEDNFEEVLIYGQNLVNYNYKKILIFSDIQGATPSNIATKIMNEKNDISYLINGVNLAMILRAIHYQNESLIEWANYAIDGGKRSILLNSKEI